MSYQDYIAMRNAELYEDIFGRGAGDPDMYGYPDEHTDNEPIGEYQNKDGNPVEEIKYETTTLKG